MCTELTQCLPATRTEINKEKLLHFSFRLTVSERTISHYLKTITQVIIGQTICLVCPVLFQFFCVRNLGCCFKTDVNSCVYALYMI
jgi:hypothetical protein